MYMRSSRFQRVPGQIVGTNLSWDVQKIVQMYTYGRFESTLYTCTIHHYQVQVLISLLVF